MAIPRRPANCYTPRQTHMPDHLPPVGHGGNNMPDFHSTGWRMVIPGKSTAFAAVIFFFVCFWAFPRSPLQNSKEPGELPSDLRGVKVYHLPEKSSDKTKGDLAVVRSAAYQEINLDHLALNLLVRMNPVDRPASVVKIYFQDLRANGLPIHVEPYGGEKVPGTFSTTFSTVVWQVRGRFATPTLLFAERNHHPTASVLFYVKTVV